MIIETKMAFTRLEFHQPFVNRKASYGRNKISVQKSPIALKILVEIISFNLKSG